ncbi:hypothetical protein [Agromyces bauzanensis]|uniref:Uncharacterized protein n=1 Tax=Agromyces bauzanensis TaxID=1308924 RepID=A0A917PE02_9MICO|nr:hypothetical protein [Agromyces bauzanensis]GGJ72269.1 hypothetical protein GCM10011372_07830 [Agromyces bauzanensis]
MWTDEDGELHEGPVAWRETVVADHVQAMFERLAKDSRDRYSDWMDEELTVLAYARELVAGGLFEEAAYRHRAAPSVELQRVSWASTRPTPTR